MPADTTETVAEHSAIKAATINQFACPSYSLYVQLLWFEGMKARVCPAQ